MLGAVLTQIIIVGIGVLVEHGCSGQALRDFHRYLPAAAGRCTTRAGADSAEKHGRQRHRQNRAALSASPRRRRASAVGTTPQHRSAPPPWDSARARVCSTHHPHTRSFTLGVNTVEPACAWSLARGRVCAGRSRIGTCHCRRPQTSRRLWHRQSLRDASRVGRCVTPARPLVLRATRGLRAVHPPARCCQCTSGRPRPVSRGSRCGAFFFMVSTTARLDPFVAVPAGSAFLSLAVMVRPRRIL